MPTNPVPPPPTVVGTKKVESERGEGVGKIASKGKMSRQFEHQRVESVQAQI